MRLMNQHDPGAPFYADFGRVGATNLTGQDLGRYVHGAIGQKYVDMWGPMRLLERPLSAEQDSHRPGSTRNDFEHGYILFGPGGAFEVHGAIADAYAWGYGNPTFGHPTLDGGWLGLPTSDEKDVPEWFSLWCAGGRVNDFEGGSITWCPHRNSEIQFWKGVWFS